MRKSGWIRAGGVVAVCAAAVLLAGCTGKEAKAVPAPVVLEFTPAEVAKPMPMSLDASIDFSGALVAPGTAVVRAKAPGTLLALDVAEGSRVKAGQVIGRIDAAELTSRMSERAAAVESARALLVQAERQHLANIGLAAQKFIAETALEASKSALDSARAQLQAAQAQLATAQLGLRETTLLAPIRGLVSKRHALPGEKLSVEQPVLTIVDLSRLELAGSVGTHEVSRLSAGMPVQVRIEGASEPVPGRLARIAPAAEPGTRSIGVTVVLDNPRETLRAGQYALARVLLAGAEPRLTLPVGAVGSTSGQDHVWVIEKGALLRRSVTTGRRDDARGRIEVLNGLAADAVVLAARFDNLREGDKAAVVTRPAGPSASASTSAPQ